MKKVMQRNNEAKDFFVVSLKVYPNSKNLS